jgi:chitosanase
MLTDTQKRSAQAIVNIFETSSVRGDYGSVTLIPGDTGQLTFGRSQTTLASGNLAKLIAAYVGAAGARFGAEMSPFLAQLQARDLALNHDRHFKNLLRASADDPVMRDVQDQFFDDVYWASAVRSARRDGAAAPLALAVIFDSVVHGSWPRLRAKVNTDLGPLASAGERSWITRYVETRREWLANHGRSDLRRTVYRMESLRRLIDQDAWDLELPLVVRGHEISLETLFAVPPNVYTGPQPRSRVVMFTTPIQRGLDVRLAQLALSKAGHDALADGLFGRVSRGIVEEFQRQSLRPVTGSLGPDDFAALGL